MPDRDPREEQLAAAMQKWADGKATLKDVRGYTAEQLYAIARTAHVFAYQGRLEEARVLFQGLYALQPNDPYYARALGFVEFAAGNPSAAIAAFDVAIKLSPKDPGAYVGRAEVRLTQGQKRQAIDDLRQAEAIAPADDPQKMKASAMLEFLGGGASLGRNRG